MENSSESSLSSASNNGEGIVASHEALLGKEPRAKRPSGGGGGDHASLNRQRHFSGKRHLSGEKPGDPICEALLSSTKVAMPDTDKNTADSDGITSTRKYLAVAVLFFINLLNYMDRFTVAGVLLSIKEYFKVNDASAGLLQTVFIISYMIVAPLFGYLGDRYNRKIVILGGMLVWSGCTLGASFITDKSQFYLFLALRGLVGVGEASYSTIAPTIIADLFTKSQRTRMLSVFFFAIPVGSGLGYIVGSAAARAFGSWHWALRVTPWLGIIAMVLLMVVIPNPRRGEAEATPEAVVEKGLDKNRSSYYDDLKYTFKNRSFMSITIGFIFMAFVVGSLTIWGPVFMAYGQIVSGALLPCTGGDGYCEYDGVSFVFGVITCVAGFLGVWIGAEGSKKWKERGNKDADAHVCAIGLICSAPLMLVGFQLAAVKIEIAWVFIFLANVSLCLTWTLVSDMTLYVTLPNRRSTAQAVQILTMHLFGDAGSPYLLGLMSDQFNAILPDSYYSKFQALQWSIYTTLFAAVLGGAGFLLASLFLQLDKKKVDDALRNGKSGTTSNSSGSVEMVNINGSVVSCKQDLVNDNDIIRQREMQITTDNHAEPLLLLCDSYASATQIKSNSQTNNVEKCQGRVEKVPPYSNEAEQAQHFRVFLDSEEVTDSVQSLLSWKAKESHI